MRKIWTVFFSVLLIAAFFCGCSFALMDTENLMQPPTPAGDKKTIQGLIKQEAGEIFNLRYPESGDYRSAVITSRDFTGDGNLDAIGFFETPDESGGTTVCFLTETDTSWIISGSFSNAYTQIERVCFGDLNGDGVQEIIIGWGSPLNKTGNICVYVWSGETIEEINLEEAYSHMAVVDLDMQGEEELFMVQVSTTQVSADTTVETPAYAKLFTLTNEGKIRVSAYTTMDSSVVRYAQVQSGFIARDKVAVVLDGIKADNSMMTEIVCWNSEKRKFELPLQTASAQNTVSVNMTLRSSVVALTSRDINGDGIIEIPTVSLMPGVEMDMALTPNYIVTWNRFDNQTNSLFGALDTVFHTADGYWLSLPNMWKEKVTCEVDNLSHTLSFYEWKTDETGLVGKGEILLRICVMDIEKWNSYDSVGRTYQLAEKNAEAYIVELFTTNHELMPNIIDLENSFHLI